MKNYKKDFPLELSSTKIKGGKISYNISDVEERKKYFQAKAGKEIEALEKYFIDNTFIAYWLGKKNSGKGTYSKLMIEIFGEDFIGHISFGDVVRRAHKDMEDEVKKKEIEDYLKHNYRGYISLEEGFKALFARDTKSIMPTEFVLTLVKREIDKMPKKTLFIDGFPRKMDQISYSLFFRDLINYREDTDIFVAIDIPESVIDARMKTRVVCPKCQAPRNPKLFVTSYIGYDKDMDDYYLMCDNETCEKVRMVAKEGDDLGIEAIRDRLKLDDQLIDKVFSLHGVPKILLRNSIPVDQADKLVDKFEITPEYVHNHEGEGKVKTEEKPWIIRDDEGVDSYSLLPAPVVVSLIKQLAKTLT